MVFGYDIKFTNRTTCSLSLEIAQYHAENFDGTKPAVFRDDLRTGEVKLIALPPGKSSSAHFNDAAGGFWVTWKTLDAGACSPRNGIIDLNKDNTEIVIK